MKLKEQKDVKKLVRALNKLRFKESEDMSHMSPHSGIIIVELYNEKIAYEKKYMEQLEIDHKREMELQDELIRKLKEVAKARRAAET